MKGISGAWLSKGGRQAAQPSPRRAFLDEVLAEIWSNPPREGRPWEHRRIKGRASGDIRYALVPTARQPVIAVPVRPWRGAASVLANYKPSARGVARLRMLILAAAARAGGLELWPTQLVRLHGRSDDRDCIEAYLTRRLDQDVLAAVYTSPPRANRKPVLHLLDGQGRTFGYAKIGMNPLTGALVRAEAAALATLAGRRLRLLRTPPVLYAGEWRGHDIVVQGALHIDRPASVPSAALAAAMVELNADASRTVVNARANAYVEMLAARLDRIATRRGQWLAAALSAWISGACDGQELALGAWHGDWTPWNMAYDGSTMSVWDWERYQTGVPAGFDALHYASQNDIVRNGRVPGAAVQNLFATAPGLLAPFGVQPDDAERVTLLYLLELAARYEADGQEAAGATLGALETWLLPALAARLGVTLQPVGK